MTRLIIYVSVVLCLIIVVGFAAGTKQLAGADNEPCGKYVHSQDAASYLELRPDGSCRVEGRGRTPSGQVGEPFELKGNYEIKGDIVTLKLVTLTGEKVRGTKDFTLKGKTLVDAEGGIWIKE
jgi:hypothetical protein